MHTVYIAKLQNALSVSYLVDELVSQMEESHHSTPVNAVSKNAPGNFHEDVLSTVALNLIEETDRRRNGLLQTEYSL